MVSSSVDDHIDRDIVEAGPPGLRTSGIQEHHFRIPSGPYLTFDVNGVLHINI